MNTIDQWLVLFDENILFEFDSDYFYITESIKFNFRDHIMPPLFYDILIDDIKLNRMNYVITNNEYRIHFKNYKFRHLNEDRLNTIRTLIFRCLKHDIFDPVDVYDRLIKEYDDTSDFTIKKHQLEHVILNI